MTAHDWGPEKEGGGPQAGKWEKRMPCGDGEEGGAGGGGREARRETQLSHGCSGPRGVPTGPCSGCSPACPSPSQTSHPLSLLPQSPVPRWLHTLQLPDSSLPPYGAAVNRGGDKTHTCCVGPAGLSLEVRAALAS